MVPGVPSSQAFLACYDADSRPPLDWPRMRERC